MFNFNVSNLNCLRTNVQSSGGDGNILRPGRGMIVLVPLQVFDCPERESARCTLGSSQRAFLYFDIIPLDWSDSSFRQSILAPSKDGKTETAFWHLSTGPASLTCRLLSGKNAQRAYFVSRIELNWIYIASGNARLKDIFPSWKTKKNIYKTQCKTLKIIVCYFF